MDGLFTLLKPAPFKSVKDGDPEALLQDFEEYVEVMKKFFTTTGAAGAHINPHENYENCGACLKEKAMMTLIGGKEMDGLFKHTGMVVEADSYKNAIKKVRDGITAQTNQSMARFKLMREMPQSGRVFSEWWPKIKEQADRCVWAGYDAKMAASDAILQQCDDKKLQKRIIAENLTFEHIIKMGVAMEQGNRKVDRMNKGGKEDRVAQLEEKVRKLQASPGFGKVRPPGTAKCSTCTRAAHTAGKCPGLSMECYTCHKKGHMKNSKACKMRGGKEKVDQVHASDTEDTDSDESVNTVVEHSTETVCRAGQKTGGCKVVDMIIQAVDKGQHMEKVEFKPLVDSGVYKTLLSEADWKVMRKRNKTLNIKKCRVKFTPYQSEEGLQMLGRTKAVLWATGGATTSTIVYVVKGSKQSLLGLKDAENLGILEVNPEGRQDKQVVRQLVTNKKERVPVTGVVSANQTQDEITHNMTRMVDKFPELFRGVGRAKVDPIHIFMDPQVKPTQQKQRKVALHFIPRLKKHLEELKAAGVVSGPLKSEDATGWVSNPVITAKKWDEQAIRVNLDLRNMEKAVRPTHFPMPTSEELRHKFKGSDRFSLIDLNHAFHQFPLDEESKNLFVFYTPWGLYRYDTLVMGVHTASSECQEKVRLLLDGLEGVQQIQDDVVVHGAGLEHDARLQAVLERFQATGITLRKEKCHFGVPEILWFGNIFSKQGMSPDPDKVKLIKSWPSPADKSEVKSFLQTAQFCSVFMRPGKGRTYSDVTRPLRKLTNWKVKFVWTKECEDSFQELKNLLCSDTVMANYELNKKTRLYVDHGPGGVAGSIAQKHVLSDTMEEAWRPVNHTGRALTTTEQGYSKVEGESLAVYSQIMTNRRYLYGTEFEVVVDHEPLVTLYNKKGSPLPVRVAKHVAKLRGFNFKVVYEPGTTTPCDYGSRHPPPKRSYTSQEKEAFGVEEEEDDMEIIVNRVQHGYMPDAVTIPVLKHFTKEDQVLAKVVQDVHKGVLRDKLNKTTYKQVFKELSVVDNMLLLGDRIVIPEKLRPDILALAHEGHPGRVSMLQQIREDMWWPGMTADLEEFVSTCSVGCGSAVARNTPPPMTVRETPEKPWQHCAADYKGPIGGKYYFHVLIDLYSRWPEVEMTKSTSMDKLYPVLDRSFGVHGVPESITHDNGPPYNGREWKKYGKECGFKNKPCSPEHPEGNGVAERFMATLVKVTHAAIAENKDPRIEVQRRLLNYRNTIHPSTGKTPASLMMNRKIRTKLPAIIKPSKDKAHREARERDAKTREERRNKLDKRRRARDIEYKIGDKVLIKQKKTTTKPPFDPKPYIITEVEGMQVTAKRGDKIKVRNKAKWKLVKERPARLQPTPRDTLEEEEDSDDDDDWYSTGTKQLVLEEHQDNEDANDGGEEEEPEAETAEPSSPIANRTRNKMGKSAQPSPRERKRRKVQAMKRDKRAGNREELRVIMKVKERWFVRDKGEEAEVLDNLGDPEEEVYE